MELNPFFFQEKTLPLSQKFLRNSEEKNDRIQELIGLFIKEKAQDKDLLPELNELFHHVHRLKGSGGTYGFNELSVLYKKMLLSLRPPYEEKRILSNDEAEKCSAIARLLSFYYPLLKSGFELFFNKEGEQSFRSVLILSKDRCLALEKIQECFLEDHFLVFLSQSVENVSLLKDVITPQIIMTDSYFLKQGEQELKPLRDQFSGDLPNPLFLGIRKNAEEAFFLQEEGWQIIDESDLDSFRNVIRELALKKESERNCGCING